MGWDMNQDGIQPTSDDQELAKVLAGVSQAADDNLQFEVASMPTITPPSDDTATIAATPAPVAEESTAPVMPQPAPAPAPVIAPVAPAGSVTVDPSLDNIKQAALSELRPLIGKLNVSPEEKFDTYLLLLRSTDDRDLIAPAHEAAKSIVDEARRAQALLDIIKEIDFLSQK